MGMEPRGVFWPMSFEADVPECRVIEGEIPKGIYGGVYHNGPTVRFPTKQGVESVWTTDGMVRGLIIEDGKASFKNRWVRTPKFLAEQEAGRALFEWKDNEISQDWRAWGLGEIISEETGDLSPNTALVNAVPFGDEILACGEMIGAPLRLDPITLETKGFPSWANELQEGIREKKGPEQGSICPHPKWDAETGMMYAWGYSDRAPHLTLHWVYPDGKIQSRTMHDAPYGSVLHDGWLTTNYFVLPFQQFTTSRDRANSGQGAFGWETDLPIMLMVINRHDINSAVRWIKADIEPQYLMHMLGANEVGDELHLDAPIFGRPPFQTPDYSQPGDPFVPFFQVAQSYLGRWIVNLKTGQVKSERVDDIGCELPLIDERFFGQNYDFAHVIGGLPSPSRPGFAVRMDRLVRRNVRTGKQEEYLLTESKYEAPFEPQFIPRTVDAREGDGYIVVPISKFKEHLGEYHFFDTDDITAGPIAKVEIPFHLGWTPHGHFMDFRTRPNISTAGLILS